MTPRKADPKWPNQRPDVSTQDVARRYLAGQSTKEIAVALACCTRTVVLRLTGAGVELRQSGKFKRFVSGHGPSWRGDAASYSAKHRRLYRSLGRPSVCSECGRTDDAVKYDWANLTGNYNDPSDYRRMCRPCHRRFDYAKARAA